MSSSILHTVVFILNALTAASQTTPTRAPTPGPTLSPTGAFLAFPSVIDGPLYREVYDVSPSHFGYHRYGGQLEGVLILPANESYHKECPQTSTEPEGPEPIGINPYIHYIRDWFISEEDVTAYILVIDRLDCYFVDKIEHAQKLGASGVIICDWRKENLFTMWMPRDWSDDITIPSVLLQNSHCETLMRHLGVQNWDPNNPQSMVYPTPEQMNWTIATIEWSLVHPDDKVDYELWTSSNDYLGASFKHNFNATAITLYEEGGTTFAPHMYVLDGSHWNCDDIINGSLPCNEQCTNSGRYCAVDPEYDLSFGVSGKDVVQENLRSLCVWEYDKAHFGSDNDIMWWDYSVLWDEECGVYSNSTNNFTANCSYAQMNALETSGRLQTYVKHCIETSGGYGLYDGENKLLRRELKLKSNQSIHSVPMISVNNYLMYGNIECLAPVTHITCQVLAAICSGFIQGTAPDICYLTPAPTIAVCNDTLKDCSGACWGHHEVDACGECLLISDPRWNECIGCNGKINETYDCAGSCGGHYAVNTCGYCKDSRIHGFLSFGVDCNGTCSMELKEDECGECIRESDTSWNACMGCDNKPNSGFLFNECGRCIDSARVDFATFGADCSGICDGDHEIDECGVCLATSSLDWNSCLGCDNKANSNKSFNECGFCIDKNAADFNEFGKDCRGLCASSSKDEMYFMDNCGQCLLANDADFGNCCGGNPDKNYNECGLCLLKSVSDFKSRGKDCNGTCSGAYVVDACGACLLPTDEAFDECMKCGQDNDMKLDCNDVCGGNHDINPCGLCLDSEIANFLVQGQDCAGNCDGNKRIDLCGNCLNTTSSEWNSCVGCDDVLHSKKELNPCDVCISATRKDFGSYGMDCAGICDGNHAVDECGQCLESSDTDWNSCIGCDGVQHSNMTYNECGACVLETDPEFDAYGRDCTGNCAKIAADTHYIDECGECLLSTDDSWNACLTTDHDANANANQSKLSLMVIIIAISAFVLICCAVVVIVYLCRKHRQMRQQFNEIQQIYRPMDDMKDTKTRNTKQTKIRVADNETD